MPTVRRATPADSPIIVEFNRRLALESEGKALDIALLSAGVAAGLADPAKALYVVAENAGEVVGRVRAVTIRVISRGTMPQLPSRIRREGRSRVALRSPPETGVGRPPFHLDRRRARPFQGGIGTAGGAAGPRADQGQRADRR